MSKYTEAEFKLYETWSNNKYSPPTTDLDKAIQRDRSEHYIEFAKYFATHLLESVSDEDIKEHFDHLIRVNGPFFKEEFEYKRQGAKWLKQQYKLKLKGNE